MNPSVDALIVGGGPAGAAAAILLARAGWSVALVERQAYPRRKVCGECLAASNLPLLDALGVGAEFAACAGPELRQVALWRAARRVQGDIPGADTRHAWGRALGRDTLDSLLLEQAQRAGAQVWQPWSVQTISGAVGHWRVELCATDSREKQTLKAAVLIDAHGSWESLGARAPERAPRLGSDLLAFKANFQNAQLAPGLLPVISFDGGYGGMVRADGGLTTLACCVRRDRLAAWRSACPGARAGDAVQTMLMRGCEGVAESLAPAAREGSWLTVGPLAPGVRLRSDDAILRIGNAAGEAHPIIGEGMSMALQSAFLLCAQLLAVPAGAARTQGGVAQRYAAQWRGQFVPRMWLANALAHMAMHPTTAAALMSATHLWPGLFGLGARWGGKLHHAADLRLFLPTAVPLASALPIH